MSRLIWITVLLASSVLLLSSCTHRRVGEITMVPRRYVYNELPEYGIKVKTPPMFAPLDRFLKNDKTGGRAVVYVYEGFEGGDHTLCTLHLDVETDGDLKRIRKQHAGQYPTTHSVVHVFESKHPTNHMKQWVFLYPLRDGEFLSIMAVSRVRNRPDINNHVKAMFDDVVGSIKRLEK